MYVSSVVFYQEAYLFLVVVTLSRLIDPSSPKNPCLYMFPRCEGNSRFCMQCKEMFIGSAVALALPEIQCNGMDHMISIFIASVGSGGFVLRDIQITFLLVPRVRTCLGSSSTRSCLCLVVTSQAPTYFCRQFFIARNLAEEAFVECTERRKGSRIFYAFHLYSPYRLVK